MATFAAAKDVALFLLALYGAALSTFNLRHAIRKDRRSVRVSLSTVMPTYGEQVGPCFAKIEATNIGHRPVTITTLTLEVPSGGRFSQMKVNELPGVADTSLPVTLSDGQSAHLYMSYRGIATGIVGSGRTRKTKVTPICVDSAGNVYKGKPWKVDPNEWSRM